MENRGLWLTTAGEYAALGLPRKCTILSEVRSEMDGGTLVAVSLDPPFSDPKLSPAAVQESAVLISRHFGNYSITADGALGIVGTLPVRVYRILDAEVLRGALTVAHQIQLFARGALTSTREQAVEIIRNVGLSDAEAQRVLS
jgi:hypothetical protein